MRAFLLSSASRGFLFFNLIVRKKNLKGDIVQITLFNDDLAHDCKKSFNEIVINDFPAIENIDFGPCDCIVFRCGSQQRILKSPVE